MWRNQISFAIVAQVLVYSRPCTVWSRPRITTANPRITRLIRSKKSSRNSENA
jgi:hypothetical protein